jgi:hypothetical protein
MALAGLVVTPRLTGLKQLVNDLHDTIRNQDAEAANLLMQAYGDAVMYGREDGARIDGWDDVVEMLDEMEGQIDGGDWAGATNKINQVKTKLGMPVGGRRRKTRKGKGKKRMTRRR